MNFQFQIKKEDYKKSLNRIFIYYLFPPLFFSLFFGIYISIIIADPYNEKSDFNWIHFILSFPIITALFLYIFWGKRYLKSLKDLNKKNEKITDSVLTVDVSESEIRFRKIDSDEEIQKKWGEFKKILQTKEFTYFLFTDGKYLFLNKLSSDSNEIEKFTSIIQEKIKSFESKMPQNLVWVSFIPGIGLIFGFVFFLRGIFERNLKYFLIGILSFISSGIGWLILGYFMDATQKNSGSNKFGTKHNLNIIVKELAYYKQKNGEFPENLDSLRSQNQFLIIYETEFKMSPFSDNKPRKFYYSIQDSTYILRAIGSDEKPFTEDDILPDY